MACRADDDQECVMSAEYSSFQSHLADLFDGIHEPVRLSYRLCAAGLLSRDARRKICELTLTEQRVSVLIDAIETMISMVPQSFYKFVDELEKDRPMQHLCDKLRSACAQLKSSQPVSSVTLPPNTSAQQIREHDTMLPSSSSSSFSSSSSSSHSSTSVIRNQYRVFLKDCYQQALPDDDKLLTTASNRYIELAVISREGVTSKEVDEFTKKSLHGLTEEILRKKAPIALKDILKPREDGKPVRCVLVEGAPGIGKSTLAWEVCHKWEKLDTVKHELVVLVRLREQKAQEARCLKDLLLCDATTNMNELITSIGRGKGVLIMCDGFDELPDEKRQKGSVYIDLIKGRLLPEATIIVTSRPSVSASLWRLCQHNIDRHLEVIGFTKEDIKRFAESVFSGDILEGFLSYITSNPPIYSMMYIPLNAVIVALIYKDSYNTDTPFPTTMTQLFDALTRALVRRHLSSTHQVPDNFCMPSSLQCIEDIYKLPFPVPEQLLGLARVAYEGLEKKRYVFTELSEDFENLSIMKKTTSLSNDSGPKCSYAFLHLTHQEYLAALHIAIANPSSFSVASNEYVGVVRFFAGICRHDEYHSHPLYQELIDELGSSMYPLQLIHCAYECPSIMHRVQVDFDSMFIKPGDVGFDWYVTGNCISHYNRKWGLEIQCSEREDNVDLLLKGLNFSSNDSGKIHKIRLDHLRNFELIIALREFCEQPFFLELSNVVMSADNTVILQQPTASWGLRLLVHVGTGPESSKKQLDMFTIRIELLPQKNTNPTKILTISNTTVQPLAALLPNITSLTYLKISDNLSDSDLPVLTNIVQSHPTLKVLEIEKHNIYHHSTILTQLIKAADNLTELIIHWHGDRFLQIHTDTNFKQLTISSALVQVIAALLPSITSLAYLEISDCVSESDLAVLTNIVQSHPTLEVLNINITLACSSTKLSTLVEAAGNCQLKKLVIGKCDIIELLNYESTNPKELVISGQLLQPLSSLLPNITSLTYLEITGRVSDSDLLVLINIVQSHPTLEVLVLGNILKSSAEIAQLVMSARNLKKLTVYGYDITELLPRNIKSVKKLTIPETIFQLLAALFLNITSLTYLEITGRVSDSDLLVLINIVQSHPTLEVLVLGYIDWILNSSAELSRLVMSARNLKKLTVYGHDITELLPCNIKSVKKLTIPETIFQLLAALFLNITSLTYLEITGCVSDSDLLVLANIVQSHPTLEVLVLGNIDWILNSSAELSRLVMSARNLKMLTVYGHDITELLPYNIKNVKKLTIPETIFQLLAALFLNITSLTYLEITGHVSDSDLPVLANIVQSHPTLEVLNINITLACSSTKLSTLVEAAGNCRLKKLVIGKCDIIELLNYESTNPKELIISDQLLQLLSSLLPNITSLTYLEITGCVSESDLLVLINIIQSHSTLEVLVLGNIDWILKSSAELSRLVVSARNLKKLTVYRYDITELLPRNIKNVKKLTIPETIFRLLAALFPNTTSLTYLEITDYVSESDLPVLTDIVQSHPTLEVLNINITLACSSTKLSTLVEAAGNCRLKKIVIGKCDIIELLNYESTNPKELIISDQLLQLLSSLLPNITSLTYLEITDQTVTYLFSLT